MKKLLLSVAVSASLCACASIGNDVTQLQKLVASFCPVVNTDLTLLATSPILTTQQQSIVASVAAVNQKVCSSGVNIDASSLQSLNATAFPALMALVAANPAIPNQPAILLGLTLAQPILAQLSALIPVK